jgi:hypothetical protein
MPTELPEAQPARFVEHSGIVHITLSPLAPWNTLCTKVVPLPRERLLLLRPVGRPCLPCTWQYVHRVAPREATA